MVSPSNPSPSDDDSIPEDQWLDAGLAALNEGDYLTALSYLAAVHQAQPNTTPGIQAQMGLVVAYERFGQPDQAIAICRDLHQNPNPQAQAWATKTLAGLAQRHPRLFPNPSESTPPIAATGFVPLQEGSAPSPRRPESRIPPISGPAPAPPPLNLPDVPSSPLPQESTARTSSRDTRSRGASTTRIQGPTTRISPQQAQPHHWRQAGRAQRWSPLPPVDRLPFWLLQLGTAIALLLLIQVTIWGSLSFYNLAFLNLPFLRLPAMGIGRDYLRIGLVLLGLLGASPWLLTGLLKLQYGMRSLPMARLSAVSPEASRVLNRLCRQHKIALPALELLPSQTPVILTYGWLPRYSRIVISQGLLDRLADDELATLYAAELGHILQRDTILSSLLVSVLQIPYLLYWWLAQGADHLLQWRRSAQGRQPVIVWAATLGFWPLVLLSALSYGLYRLLRCPALWFSQLRLYYSDRLAVEATGNPNGLTRALLKMAVGVAETIQDQGHTDPVLESFELLMPVGYRQALSLGSTCAYQPFEALLDWDRLNPWRYWMAMNQAHPLLGDRLDRLARYAQRWRLDPELQWSTSPSPYQPLSFHLNTWLGFLLQGAPFFGLFFGFCLGLGFWFLGGLATLADVWALNWLFGNRWVLLGCLPMGFSIGTFLRINPFFKEIKAFQTQTATSPVDYLVLLNTSSALPIDSPSVCFQGKLLGRRGVANWLGQDLILETETGLIPLHHTHALGPMGALLSSATRPEEFVQQSVVATGWFRRGATPWVDLELLRSKRGKISYSGHPIWSTVLACIAALIGSYWIYSLANPALL